IDTLQDYVLLGTSLGGMICAELANFLHPQKTILISSARHKYDLPVRYRVQRFLPFHYLVPGSFIKKSAQILQPIVEPDSKSYRAVFTSMLNSKSPTYMKRSVRLIMEWDRKSNSQKIYRIHGDKDRTIPLQDSKSIFKVIEDGSHMITLTRAFEVSKAIAEILEIQHE
ncbi:MAG: alpha/beta fold hydrolase, partial [Leadbetterella sp.]